MLLLAAQELWEGLVAAAPVRHPRRPEIDLVLPGVALDQRMINTIRRLGVRQMWVRWPSLDFLDPMIHSHVEDLRDDVYSALKRDFEASQGLTVGVSQYMRYRNLIGKMLVELLRGTGGFGSQTAALHDNGQGIFDHAANVAYLSLTLGLRMENYVIRERRKPGQRIVRDLTNLGVGAMLHDIGKLELPTAPEWHEPVGGDAPADYRQHPYAGYNMIRDRVSPTVRAVVLQHHQRFDGKGFPDMAEATNGRVIGALSGRDIHIFPRIVTACDTFDHLCHDESGRRRPPVVALYHMLAAEYRERFDPAVLRGLLLHVPPFGIGMQVTLSNGTRAAVVEMNRLSPCRPVVRVLDTPEGEPVRDIDLTGQSHVWIKSCLGEDIERWLFELPPRVAKPGRWTENAAPAASASGTGDS